MAKRARLREVLSRAVASALLGGAGCGGGWDDVELPPDEAFAPLECEPREESMFADLELARDFDFIALRLRNISPNESEPAAATLPGTESNAVGTPCSGARDLPRCQQALAAAWPNLDSGWRHCEDGCVVRAIVLTSGDQVLKIDDHRQLLSLLGNIETSTEVVLLAQAHQFDARCSDSRIADLPGGFALTVLEATSLCPLAYDELTLKIAAAGAVEVVRRAPVSTPSDGVCVGRRPEGLLCSKPSARSRGASDGDALMDQMASVGQFFADVARLERGAVIAFRVMAAELAALGAPVRLQRAALRAARDEVRHAELMTSLARRYGAEPVFEQIHGRPLRSLFAFALDNVIEGCVRETYGAACARYQATRARAADVREQLGSVARDEARHAELSWQIHEWACARLSDAERDELASAAHRAVAELRRELEHDRGRAVQTEAGMPGPRQARTLLDALDRALWSASALAA
jgi:hypothetical protein